MLALPILLEVSVSFFSMAHAQSGNLVLNPDFTKKCTLSDMIPLGNHEISVSEGDTFATISKDFERIRYFKAKYWNSTEAICGGSAALYTFPSSCKDIDVGKVSLYSINKVGSRARVQNLVGRLCRPLHSGERCQVSFQIRPLGGTIFTSQIGLDITNDLPPTLIRFDPEVYMQNKKRIPGRNLSINLM